MYAKKLHKLQNLINFSATLLQRYILTQKNYRIVCLVFFFSAQNNITGTQQYCAFMSLRLMPKYQILSLPTQLANRPNENNVAYLIQTTSK